MDAEPGKKLHYRRIQISRTVSGSVDDHATVQPHLSQAELALFAEPSAESPEVMPATASLGFRAASHQWRRPQEENWCTLKEFHLIGMARPKSRRNASDSWYNIPIPFMAFITRKIRIESSGHGEITGLVVQCARVPLSSTFFRVDASQQAASSPDDAFTARFLREMQLLDSMYSPMRSSPNGRQWFLLQVYHAHLNLFAAFLGVFSVHFLEPRMCALHGPAGKQRIFRWKMDELRRDSGFLRDLKRVGAEMRATLESTLDVTLAAQGNTTTASAIISAEIQGSIREAWTHLEQMADGVEHKTDLLTTTRERRQSDNVRQLTILATIFLPLSLSAGILSMQARFKDLGPLLFDFFAVFSILAVLATLFIAALLLYDKTSELNSRLQYNTKHTYLAFTETSQGIAKVLLLIFAFGLALMGGIGMFSPSPNPEGIFFGLVIWGGAGLFMAVSSIGYRYLILFRARRNTVSNGELTDGPQGDGTAVGSREGVPMALMTSRRNSSRNAFLPASVHVLTELPQEGV
ncbi:uncharacterized protein F5Z01DRAFT_174142 [Emericellopsis atlantica]|uniref:Uncharacterized protein n=1 Tax=Emericellopsis atlantica TaxID=2614577 RepID=A0A9P7ZK41_9HYPO|nr:uncharacterized protein F5Z01DRAFT_174142 [Emericellopsis atlantica]KAG9253085.1 hypothetical protein F5Z01DRAFT_174142 [Emericellopsis atlantica]